MSSSASVMMLFGAILVGQSGVDKVVHTAPNLEVYTAPADDREVADLMQNYLLHNRIYWGRNYLRPKKQADRGDADKDFSRLPTTYYHPNGPLGVAFRHFNWFPGEPNTFHADARIVASLVALGGQPHVQLGVLWSEPPVAVLGINVGTEAAYARPFQPMHFFERNPHLIALSQPPKGKPAYFSFIPDAKQRGAAVKVISGEHRAQFAKQGGARFYHLIVVELCKEDADEKLHEDLLTREAMEMLMSKLADDGVLCFHTSHRYLNLPPLIASVAKDCGYQALVGQVNSGPQPERGLFSSEWVMVARAVPPLVRLRMVHGGAPIEWRVPETRRSYVWREGAKNSLAGLWRSSPVIGQLRTLAWRVEGAIAGNDIRTVTVRKWMRPVYTLLDVLDRLSVEIRNRQPAEGPQSRDSTLAGLPIAVRDDAMPNPSGGPLLEYHSLLFHRINIGSNFAKPHVVKDIGNPFADFSRLPTAYHHPKGPAGRAFALFDWFAGPSNSFHADVRLPASLIGLGGHLHAQLVALWSEPAVAVLGLEVGTPAGYARPFQTMHFTERVPAFIALSLPKADTPPTFRYIRDALDRGANVRILAGEPRPTFARHGGEKFYRLILVDTYKDGISTIHKDLLTREGMAVLMSKLDEKGVLGYHISNRYYDLEPVIAAAAADLGYAYMSSDNRAQWRDEMLFFTSRWMMIARKPEYLAPLKAQAPQGYEKALPPGFHMPFWYVQKADPRFLWRDGAKNSLRGLVMADPLTGGLDQGVFALHTALATVIGDEAARYATDPIHGMLATIGRWRVEALNRQERVR